MSTRAMASRYTAQPPPNMVSPTGGGGTGLMSLLTGNSPKQLQAQQFQHNTAIQQMMQQHEKDMEELQNQHSKELLEKQGELADKLRNNSTVVKAADSAGVSVDEYIKSIMPQASANALKKSQLEGKGMDTTAFVDSLNRGNVAKNLQPEVANAADLAKASKAELGSGLNMSIVKGVNDAPNSAFVSGATQHQGITPFGGMVDPKTGQTIGQQALPYTDMRPGGVSFPVDPAIRDKVMGGGQPQVNVDPTKTGVQPAPFDLSMFLGTQGQPTGMDIGSMFPGAGIPQQSPPPIGGQPPMPPPPVNPVGGDNGSMGNASGSLMNILQLLQQFGGFQGRQ